MTINFVNLVGHLSLENLIHEAYPCYVYVCID